MEEKVNYHKVCKNPKCNREYDTTSRNQKYCCSECTQYMSKVLQKKSRKRAVKRREYNKNAEINRALSSAYTLAHKVADLFNIPKVCGCGEVGCEGDLELHHKDSNPFNNNPNNLVYLTKSHHKREHDKNPLIINMVDTYCDVIKEAESQKDSLSEKEYSELLITLFNNKFKIESLL